MYKHILKHIKKSVKNNIDLQKNNSNFLHSFQKPHILMSAENPYYHQELKLSHDDVRNMLHEKGYDFSEIQGHYGKPERSFMIHNPPESSLPHFNELARKLGQDSIIHSTGNHHEMHYLNGENTGKYIKGQGTEIHHNQPEDFYSTDASGKHFSHNFDFGTLHDQSNIIKNNKIPKVAGELEDQRVVDPSIIKNEKKPHMLDVQTPNTTLIHFSNRAGLKTIDPNHMGARGIGSESKRGVPENKISFFYLEGTKPESIVTSGAQSKYTTTLGDKKVYDIGSDPDNILSYLKQKADARPTNPGMVTRDEYHEAIRNKGYHGIYNSSLDDTMKNAIGMFHPMNVESEHPIHPNDTEVASAQDFHKVNKNELLMKAPYIGDEDSSNRIGRVETFASSPTKTTAQKYGTHLATNQLKNGLYHHVFDNRGEINHNLSTSADPSNESAGVANMSGERVNGGFQVGFSNVRPDKDNEGWFKHRGKGYGKQLYLSALAHHGKMYSDTILTDRSNGVWEKLPELSEGHVQVKLSPTTRVRYNDAGEMTPESATWHEATANQDALRNHIFMPEKSGKLAASESINNNLNKAASVQGAQKPMSPQEPLAPTRNQLQPQSSNITPEVASDEQQPKPEKNPKVDGIPTGAKPSAIKKDENKKNKSKRGLFNAVVNSIKNKNKQEIIHKHDDLKKAYIHNGLVSNPAPQVKLNPEHGKTIANAYEQMKHDPQHPQVKSAYNSLINETKQQYQKLLDQGYKFSKINPGQANPYTNSDVMHQDIGNNKHLHYFPTDSGFGSTDETHKDHPMLQPTEFKDPEGKPMLANDVFRQVHDINGHHMGGKTKFGPTGEHQAYLNHKKMYSPEAQKALATETMGQNSWVTAGPHAEHNKKNPGQTVFAEQKAGLMPEHIVNGDWHNPMTKSEVNSLTSHVLPNEETNTLMNRFEDKYFLPAANLQKLIVSIKSKLTDGDTDTSVRNNHNMTIYLDNRDLDSFRDNLEGIKPRFKVRIRRYNPNGEGWENVAYIELKIKEEDGFTNKVRIRIPAKLIDSVAKGMEIKLNQLLLDTNRDISKQELWKRVTAINSVISKYGFKKQVVVEYNRRAYSSNKIRITIDDSLKYHSCASIESDLLDSITNSKKWKGIKKPTNNLHHNDLLILEVKHGSKIPDAIVKLLKQLNAEPVSFSKYCAAIVTYVKTKGNTSGLIQRQKLNMEVSEITEILRSEVASEVIEIIKNENLMKGSLQRKMPFNPLSQSARQTQREQREWTENEDMDVRENVSKIGGNPRLRALNKLAAKTHVRKHPETGERLFLMHRGMGENEYKHRHKDGATNYPKGERTSWSHDRAVAAGFGTGFVESTAPGSDVSAANVSAWIPESALVHNPNQFNAPSEKAIADKKRYPDSKNADRSLPEKLEGEWIVQHDQPFQHAHPKFLDQSNKDERIRPTLDDRQFGVKKQIAGRTDVPATDKKTLMNTQINYREKMGAQNKPQPTTPKKAKKTVIKTEVVCPEQLEPDLQKPFRSEDQRKFAYANSSKFGGKEGIAEWESETPAKLPKKKKSGDLKKYRKKYGLK